MLSLRIEMKQKCDVEVANNKPESSTVNGGPDKTTFVRTLFDFCCYFKSDSSGLCKLPGTGLSLSCPP